MRREHVPAASAGSAATRPRLTGADSMRNIPLLHVLAVLALAACSENPPTGSAAPSSATPPRAATSSQVAANAVNGRIAFNRTGTIYVMEADGSGATPLTGGTAPAWSPSGWRIAFNRGGDVYVMNADGSGQINVTNNPANDASPTWSPDGKRIAFSSDRDGNDEIYVMNSDGSSLTRITSNTDSDFEPSWSPDGSRIAFTSTRTGMFQIFVMNADGTNQTRLVFGAFIHRAPKWTPDGRVVYYAIRAGYEEIGVINADGSGEAWLTDDTYDLEPAWSPDGSKVVFKSFRNQAAEIWVMNGDGTGVTRLTNNNVAEGEPAWGPMPTGAAPIADVGGPYSGLEGMTLAFSGAASSDPDGGALTYQWDFGDGTNGTGVSPSHTYADNGSYNVTLTVSDPDGASASATAVAAISNVAPLVDAGPDGTAPPAGTNFDFTGSFIDSGVNDGPWSVSINWGDGSASTPLTVTDQTLPISASHIYGVGTYTIKLLVTDKDLGAAYDVREITVPAANRQPTANPGGPYQSTEGSVLAINGAGSSDPDGDVLTYTWDFGDGSTGSGAAPTHTYAASGNYTVTLIVSDGKGGSDTRTATATIANVAPTVTGFALSAYAVYLATGSATVTVSGITYSDPAGAADAPYGTAIDCGNNTQANAAGECTYVAVGTYTVSVVVSDKDGAASLPRTAQVSVRFTFGGFGSPVDAAPVLNVAKAGQAIPLKWRLVDATGAPVTNLTTATVSVVTLSCSIGQTPDQLEEYGNGNSGLQNLGNGYYQFNWKTPKSYANSCKTMHLDLGEGITRQALFQFK
jgi:PKD repeat protein